MGKFLDLTGKTFGRLTVFEQDIEYAKQHNIIKKGTYWKCKCSCDNLKTVRTDHLTSGKIVSCGCYVKEQVYKKNHKEITGQRFGKLVAFQPTNKRARSSVIWECRCDCGNTAFVSCWNLCNGSTISCGCIVSKGEYKISQLLKENGLNFTTQKTFEDCKSEKNYKLRFDFFIENKYLVEFDGIQHFECSNIGWDTTENFLKVQHYDNIKKEYCIKNNIPLRRIPYWAYNNLTIEDIISDKYLIEEQK